MAMSVAPKYAIIGAGVAGSFAAWKLASAGAAVTVFEMGRGAGGRCSSRRTREIPGLYIDHGCPAFTADGTPEWLEIVKDLVASGSLEPWDCSTGFLEGSKAKAATCPQLYRGPNGMDNFCTRLLQNCEKRFSTVVSGLERQNGQWILQGKDGELMKADHVIVSSAVMACKARWSKIFGKTSSPPLHEFTSEDPELMKAVEILEAKGDTAKPVFTVLMAFKTESAKWLENIPFDLTIVQGNPVVHKIVRNRCKTADYVTVTVHSTHEFAAKSVTVYGSKSSVARLQGQSATAKEQEKEVCEQLYGSFMNLAGQWGGQDAPQWGPCLHRWGAAFSPSSLEQTPVIDNLGLSICGDFIGTSAGSVQGAAISGYEVATQALERHFKQS